MWLTSDASGHTARLKCAAVHHLGMLRIQHEPKSHAAAKSWRVLIKLSGELSCNALPCRAALLKAAQLTCTGER